MDRVKALALLSGGLDSMLAVKVLERQGIAVTAACFTSPFFGAQKAMDAAKELGIELRIIDISAEILGLVKNPPSGYGKNLNPCIDCHALMIAKAGEAARQEGCAFVATGEVLGQRPLSQNRQALERVRVLSGVDVLRPLSAKLLPETTAEQSGLVNRARLEDIQGRGRDRQMELAVKFKIKEYPSPAGGCLLTDPEYSARLGRMLEYWPNCAENDARLLRFGRVYWLKQAETAQSSRNHALLMIGRNEKDNDELDKFCQKGDIVVKLKDSNGPTSLMRGLAHSGLDTADKKINIPQKLELSSLHLDKQKDFIEIMDIALLLTGYYYTKARGKKAEFLISNF